MARILYSVMGNTYGHISRSLALAARMPEHEFYFVGGGRVPAAMEGKYPCLEVPVLRTVHKKQSVDIAAVVGQITHRVLEIPSVTQQIEDLIDDFQPDLAIVDREFFTPFAAKNKGLRMIAVNHSGLILSTSYPVEKSQWLSWFLAYINDRALFDFTDENLSVSFYHPELIGRGKDSLYPPVVRPEVLEYKPSQGEHILVYQTSPTFGQLMETLQHVSRPVIVYGFRQEDVTEGNVTYKSYNPTGILEDLSSCAYAVVNGGHNLISEALYYKKPVLCFPIAMLFEQFLNSFYIEKLGYGQYSMTKTPPLSVFDDFENNLEFYRSNLEGKKMEGTDEVVAAIQKVVTEELDRPEAF